MLSLSVISINICIAYQEQFGTWCTIKLTPPLTETYEADKLHLLWKIICLFVNIFWLKY